MAGPKPSDGTMNGAWIDMQAIARIENEPLLNLSCPVPCEFVDHEIKSAGGLERYPVYSDDWLPVGIAAEVLSTFHDCPVLFLPAS